MLRYDEIRFYIVFNLHRHSIKDDLKLCKKRGFCNDKEIKACFNDFILESNIILIHNLICDSKSNEANLLISKE